MDAGRPTPAWSVPFGICTNLDAGRGPAQHRAAAKSEMVKEPCRSVFMQFGRWIVI